MGSLSRRRRSVKMQRLVLATTPKAARCGPTKPTTHLYIYASGIAYNSDPHKSAA